MNGILHKITCDVSLSGRDLNPRQKESLFMLMEKYGASRAFTYDRFFKEGFRLWELIGIDFIKDQFFLSTDHKDLFDYQNVLRLGNKAQEGWFYGTIGNEWGLKSLLKGVMTQLGMLSEVTIANRFSSDNWKDYERRGIVSILAEFENEPSVDFDSKAVFDRAWQQMLSNRSADKKGKAIS